MDALDFIVVGQGIAGSCAAYELMRRGLKVAIIDDSWRSAACVVAAGVINPITGKRLVKSWRSELAHPFAMDFYSRLEGELGAKFYHTRKILQLCRSDEECALWRSRLENPDYSEYVEASLPPGSFPGLNDSRGSHLIGRSAWVEAPAVMEAFRKFFVRRRALVEERFDFSRLALEGALVRYKNLAARKIVFAEGWRAAENPFFSWLPWRPAKGEILEIESGAELPEYVVHRGNWIMKCARGRFRIGSTWDRENLNSIPTRAAREELESAVKNILPACRDAKVVGHQAGVRPCTATTRPHIGEYPADSRLLCFNGFGSKGYALSPYFARRFADSLCGNCPPDSEADLSRHVRKFFRR